MLRQIACVAGVHSLLLAGLPDLLAWAEIFCNYRHLEHSQTKDSNKFQAGKWKKHGEGAAFVPCPSSSPYNMPLKCGSMSCEHSCQVFGSNKLCDPGSRQETAVACPCIMFWAPACAEDCARMHETGRRKEKAPG